MRTVGTDSSRPVSDSIAEQDAMKRSLQKLYSLVKVEISVVKNCSLVGLACMI